jgi:hypothetical protein
LSNPSKGRQLCNNPSATILEVAHKRNHQEPQLLRLLGLSQTCTSFSFLVGMSECVQMSKASPLFILVQSLSWGRILFLEILFPLYYFPMGRLLFLEILFPLYYFPAGRLLFMEILFPLYYFPMGRLLFWGVLQLFNGLPLTSWNLPL